MGVAPEAILEYEYSRIGSKILHTKTIEIYMKNLLVLMDTVNSIGRAVSAPDGSSPRGYVRVSIHPRCRRLPLPPRFLLFLCCNNYGRMYGATDFCLCNINILASNESPVDLLPSRFLLEFFC